MSIYGVHKLCRSALHDLSVREALKEKVQAVFSAPEYPEQDAELSLYSGFLPDADKGLLAKVREASADALWRYQGQFRDARYDELLFRYRARHWPERLKGRQPHIEQRDGRDREEKVPVHAVLAHVHLVVHRRVPDQPDEAEREEGRDGPQRRHDGRERAGAEPKRILALAGVQLIEGGEPTSPENRPREMSSGESSPP